MHITKKCDARLTRRQERWQGKNRRSCSSGTQSVDTAWQKAAHVQCREISSSNVAAASKHNREQHLLVWYDDWAIGRVNADSMSSQ
jgi:hypothetical protein